MKYCSYLLTVILLASCSRLPADDLYTKKPGYYSYVIGDIGAAEPSLAANSDVYVAPASCQKIITTLLAYKQLGPEYRYQTDLYVTADKQEAIVRFSGDPTLTSEQLAKLLHHLPTEVKHLWLDNSLFQTPALSPNIMRDDVGSFYAQPVSAMNLDHNQFHVTVNAGELGTKAHIENELGYNMTSRVVTSTEPTAVSFSWEKEQLVARGHINIKDTTRQFTVSPAEIEPYLELRLKPLVHNMTLHFTALPYPLPQGAERIASISSKPLKDIIPKALKRSDNMILDSLYLTIINQIQPGIEKWEQGDTVVKQLLVQHFGLSMQNALIIDGSGLSHYNRLQPRQLYALLQKAYDTPGFREALATPGEKGSTLKRRNLPTTIKAKTGSMSGIACICGYNIRASASQAFAFIATGFAPPLSEVYGVQDTFLRQVLESR